MLIKSITSKSILTKSRLPGTDYVINPYIGCTHRCIYCYAKFMCRFTDHQHSSWGSFVDIKINAQELLSRKLKSFNPASGRILLGSVTDAYQPIERTTGLTRRLLNELAHKDCKISILTKSDLVTRDIDILKKFQHCSVGISICCLDEKIRKAIEPGAPPIYKRLDAIRALHNAGLTTYLFIGPIIPTLTPITQILESIHESIDEVWAETLNIKTGCADKILSVIKSHSFQPTEYSLPNSNENFWNKIEDEFRNAAKKHNISVAGYFRH